MDGISPAAVAAATAAAAEAGVPLEAWLNRVIRETAEREQHARQQPRSEVR